MPCCKKQGSCPSSCNFIMSGSAALVGKTLTAPLSRTKLLLQAGPELARQERLDAAYFCLGDCMTTIYRTEGLSSFWRGSLLSIVSFIPTSALNCVAKKQVRSLVKIDGADRNVINIAKTCAAGGVAGIISLSITYPIDVAYTRLATDIKSRDGQQEYTGIIDVFKKTMETSGVSGLYRGFAISCVGMSLYRGLYSAIYGNLKEAVSDSTCPMAKCCLALGASVIAGVLTYPLDTVRVRLIVSSGQDARYEGAIDCFRKIVREEGVLSLWRGVDVSVLTGVVTMATTAAVTRLARAAAGKIHQ